MRKQLFREALESLLSGQPDMRVVGHYASERTFPHGPDGPAIDCLIAVYNRAEAPLEAFCQAVSQLRRVLVISGELAYDELGRVRSVAAGIVPDTARGCVLLDAVRAVARGQTWKEVVLLDGSTALGPAAIRVPLTHRQRLVLHHLYEGLSNKQIAAALGVSYPSVKATMQQLFEKIGVRTRSQLVRTAIERIGVRGVTRPEPDQPAMSARAHAAGAEGKHG